VENTLGLEIEGGRAGCDRIRLDGQRRENIADQVAVEAMRERMNKIYMRGHRHWGGERDEAPCSISVGICTVKTQNLLQPDELIEIDIAVDPAKALTSSLTVKTAQWQFWLLRRKVLFAAPDFYMRKPAPLARGHVDINKSATQNLKILSECLNRAVEELVVVVMDRPRHKDLIQEIRQAGARVRLMVTSQLPFAARFLVPTFMR